MATYLVTMEVELKTAILEEVYEIEAVNIDEAERLVSVGEGELVHEEITDFGITTAERISSIKTI